MQVDYLEDFVDKIGHLSSDVSTILTGIRMGDLKAKRDNDQISRKSSALFENGMNMSKAEQDAAYQEICNVYEKSKEHSSEKLHFADKTVFMLDKILKHLDNTITKYTNEVESQQPGLTTSLRVSSLDLDRESREMSTHDPRSNRNPKRKLPEFEDPVEVEVSPPLPESAAPPPTKRSRVAQSELPSARGIGGDDRRKTSIIPEGTKVVSRLQAGEANWVLTKVVRFRSGRYMVADLDPNISDEFTLLRKDVLQLTGDTVTYTPGEKVLALYPETTCFYPAIVVGKIRRNGRQLYRLHFEDDENVDGTSRTTDLNAIDVIKTPKT